MEPFTIHVGLAAPLDRINVDTDQIIPKQFMKRIERTGYEDVLFFNWRHQADGSPNPDFVLNQPQYQGASVLIAGSNFGSGSSREHAVWALQNFGFRAIIAPSFADIFFSNCFKNGILPLTLPEASVRLLMERAATTPGYQLTVDLVNQTVLDYQGFQEKFTVDPFRRRCLIEGLDEIGLTLLLADDISAFEAKRESFLTM